MTDKCEGCRSHLFCMSVAQTMGEDFESFAIKKDCRKRIHTNADRIRAMSDEELAEFLCDSSDCYLGKCIAYDLCHIGNGKSNGLKKWLKQPAEVDNG